MNNPQSSWIYRKWANSKAPGRRLQVYLDYERKKAIAGNVRGKSTTHRLDIRVIS
jgi:hypothetical protein